MSVESEQAEIRRLSEIRRGSDAERELAELFGLDPDEVMSLDFTLRQGARLTLNVALQPKDASGVVAVLKRYQLVERAD